MKISISANSQKEIDIKLSKYLKNDYMETDTKPYVAWAKNWIGKPARIRLLSYINSNMIQTGIVDAGKNLKNGKYIIKIPEGGSILVEVV